MQSSFVAANPATITPYTKHLEIADHLQYTPDENTLTIEQLLDKSNPATGQRWQHLEANYVPAKFFGGKQWLKLNVTNSTPTTQHWYLAIEQSAIHALTAFITDNNRVIKQWNMGDQIPFHNRPVDHRHFLIPIELQPNESQTVFVQLQSASISYIPVSLLEQKHFWIKDSKINLFFGLYFGIFLVMIFYNLFIYLSIREQSYLVYGIYVSIFLLLQTTLYGFSFQLFWPRAYAFNGVSPVIIGSASLSSAAWFVAQFLQLRQCNLAHYYLVTSISVLGLLITFIAFFVPYDVALFLAASISLFGCSCGCYIIIKQWLDGNQAARFLLIAWLTLLASAVLYIADRTGLTQHNLAFEFALLVGSVIEIVMLSFALADRINLEKSISFETQKQLITVQKQANENLETQVESRTSALRIALKSLSAANESLLDISTTDSLTGVKNRRFFDSRFDNEYRRSRREQTSLSILLVDIDRFKEFNDTYGHIAGDICIRSVAQEIEQTLQRPSDCVSRYGGEEFCIILYNTDQTGAMHIAEKIRLNIEKLDFLLDTGTLNVTVSIGASSVVPGESCKPELVLHTADLALYEAKENGRNQVCYRPPSAPQDYSQTSSSA